MPNSRNPIPNLTRPKEKPAGKILNLPANKDWKSNTPLFSNPATDPTRTGGEAPWINAKVGLAPFTFYNQWIAMGF
jgi:hypothetical protein